MRKIPSKIHEMIKLFSNYQINADNDNSDKNKSTKQNANYYCESSNEDHLDRVGVNNQK